jgi:outer membrane lipoprotein-sorting protein
MKENIKSGFWIVAFFVFVVGFIGLILGAASSCTNTSNNNKEEVVESYTGHYNAAQTYDYTDRFVIVEVGKYNTVNIVYDKNTMVMYAMSVGRYNMGSLSVLYDSTGKPLLWKSK